jgi:putative oxidoreductase
MSKLSRLEEPAFALLRVITGVMFMCHGLQKMFGVLGKSAIPFASHQMWIGGVIELVCGLAIAAGLFTRIAAILASGTMAVAYFQFHMKGDFAGNHWLPIVNGGELAVVFCWLFLFFAVRGPGPYSLDRSFKIDA